jgi:hypothetical protein
MMSGRSENFLVAFALAGRRIRSADVCFPYSLVNCLKSFFIGRTLNY